MLILYTWREHEQELVERCGLVLYNILRILYIWQEHEQEVGHLALMGTHGHGHHLGTHGRAPGTIWALMGTGSIWALMGTGTIWALMGTGNIWALMGTQQHLITLGHQLGTHGRFRVLIDMLMGNYCITGFLGHHVALMDRLVCICV